MEITTEMIKQLRGATNAPMLDCRKALQEADGDFDKAVDWLRKKAWQPPPNVLTAMLPTESLNCIPTVVDA